MPANIAMEIARAPDGDIQQALAEAYENKLLPGNQVLAIRRIVAQRNRRREKPPRGGGPHTGKVTAAALIQSYETEAQRQKLLVKKADLAQTRLTFVVNALRRLLTDEEFLPPLRAEAMHTLPRSLADQLELSEVRMSDPVKLGFERQVVVLARCEILPMRRVLDRIKQTVRYKRIVASIAEVGIVEPLVVTRREVAGPYMLVDGHLGHAALMDLGSNETPCLIADDDEAFTYNKRVNRLATVQEHYMTSGQSSAGYPRTSSPGPLMSTSSGSRPS
jgi:hypothetical protein